MPYIKTTWKNKETKLNETNMNHIEAGIEAVENYIKSVESNTAASLDEKQDKLVSSQSIKTINGESVLGSGNIEIATDLSEYYTKAEIDDLIKKEEVIEPFLINGIENKDSEIVLKSNAVYELSGTLNGHIIIKAEAKDRTILVFNNVTIKSDITRAIYCEQPKSKTVIVLMKDTKNYIETVNTACSDQDSPAAIQSEDTLMIVSDKNSELYTKATGDNQHAIKASELFLNGCGYIKVSAGHDGFHGGKLMRIDSGKYHVEKAKVDGFEAKYLQILGGEIIVDQYGQNAVSSKETEGIIAGYSAKFKVTGDTLTNFSDKFRVLATVEELPKGISAKTSLADKFGTGIVYQSKQKVNKDSTYGDSDGFPTEAWISAATQVNPDEAGNYNCSLQYVYAKGYFSNNKIICNTAKTKLFLDDIYINNDSDAALYYAASSGKLEVKGKKRSINYIVSKKTALLSNRAVSLQEDANYIIKGDEIAVKTSATEADGYIFTKGDGLKYFEGKIAIDSPDVFFSIDGLDDSDLVNDDVFAVGPVEARGLIKANKSVYVPYCQIGSAQLETFDTRKLAVFDIEGLDVKSKWNNENAQVITYNNKELLNSIRDRIYSLEEKKQEKLVSGENIKTINNESILGIGNIVIPAGKRGEKGDKGDPFTYEDFTAEQLEALKGKDGKDGQDGAPGKDGQDGAPGKDASVTAEAVGNVLADSESIVKNTENGAAIKLELAPSLKTKYDNYDASIKSVGSKLNDIYTKTETLEAINKVTIGTAGTIAANIGGFTKGDAIKATDTLRDILKKLLFNEVITSPTNTPMAITIGDTTTEISTAFNSTETTYNGKLIGKLDVNGQGEIDCIGYGPVKLSADNLELTVDKAMRIVGIMAIDSLDNAWKPLGSGKKTFAELAETTENETTITYKLNDTGVKAANSLIPNATDALIIIETL